MRAQLTFSDGSIVNVDEPNVHDVKGLLAHGQKEKGFWDADHKNFHCSDGIMKISEVILDPLSTLPVDYADADQRARQRDRDGHNLRPVVHDFPEYFGDE